MTQFHNLHLNLMESLRIPVEQMNQKHFLTAEMYYEDEGRSYDKVIRKD